jgi:hypothetical protein
MEHDSPCETCARVPVLRTFGRQLMKVLYFGSNGCEQKGEAEERVEVF